ncbi:MAG: Mov34/MPN/PAD-1 family protein [Bacteroidota bacterium]
MKIKSISKVEAIDIQAVNDDRFLLFKDRKKLHEDKKIPEYFVYINGHAWDSFKEFADRSYEELKHEASGILLGQYFKDEFGEFIVAHQFEQGTGESTNQTFCEISYEDMARITEIGKNERLIQVVWIHSHPGFSAFYSGRDKLTLKSYYHHEYQLGIVMDNIRGEYKAFKIIKGKVKETKNLLVYNHEEGSAGKPFEDEKSEEEINEKKNSPEQYQETKSEYLQVNLIKQLKELNTKLSFLLLINTLIILTALTIIILK